MDDLDLVGGQDFYLDADGDNDGDANAPLFECFLPDLVASTAHPDQRQLHRDFNRAIEAANARYADRLVSPLTITLGDEFQGLATSLRAGFICTALSQASTASSIAPRRR